jgi:hypothetical protein
MEQSFMADTLDSGTVTPDPASDASASATADTAATATATDTATTDATATDTTAAAADTPVEYTPFVMPEGVTLDQAAADRAIPVFKELGLSQEQAQKLVNAYATELNTAVSGVVTPEAIQGYMDKVTAERSTQWAEQVKADKDIGGAHLDETKAFIAAGIAKYGTPELAAALNETGLGNHPELVRLFRKIGADVREDRGGLPAGGGGAEKSLAERMYPPK